MSLAARRLGGHRDQDSPDSFLASPDRPRKSSQSKSGRRVSIGALLLTLVASGGIWLVAQSGGSAWAGTVSLLPDNAVPRTMTDGDTVPVELGMRFKASRPVEAVGVQFYKGPHNTGRHTGTLWTSRGHRLARVTFTHETKRGLQRARFNKPIALRPNVSYVVSYTARAGRYSVDEHYFTRRISNSLLSAGRNAGVYSYRAGTFPKRSYAASNYGVDIVVRPKPGHNPHGTSSPTTSPTPVSTPAVTTAPTTVPTSTPSTTTPSSAPSTTTPSSTPSTTTSNPTPAGGAGCAVSTANTPGSADRSGGCWPGSSNTGVPAGVSLKRVPQDVTSAAAAGGTNTGWTWDSAAGGIRITAVGATISGVDVSGGIIISATKSNMTVVNTRFRCTNVDNGEFCGALGANSTMTDTEIGGGADGKTYINSQGFWVGGSSSKNVLRRVNIHHIVHGFHIDGGTTLEDSYVHDMPAGDPAGNDTQGVSHTDGVFVSTGGNMTFRHNTFAQAANNCSLFVQDYDGTAEGVYNLSVLDSLFISTNRNGQQTSYGVGIENKSIKGPSTIHVEGNVFSQGWQVAPIEAPTGAAVSGNTYTNGSSAPVVWAR